MDLLDHVDAYRADLKQRVDDGEEAPNTVKQKNVTINHFEDYCDAENVVLDLEDEYESAQAVIDFFDTDRIKLSGTRLYHLRDLLDYVGKQLARDSLKAQDQLLDIRDKLSMRRLEPDEKDETHQKEPEFIPDEEIEAAFQEAPEFGELVLQMLYDTGCRKGELAVLTREDITFDPDQDGVAAAVRVNKTHDGNGGVKMRPKSEMGFRTVELTPRTVDMLKDYLEDEYIGAGERIFKQYSLQYTSRKIGNIVKDAFTQADVHINPETGRSFVSPHWMRHQRNSRLRKQYGKETAMQYMGHEDEDTSDDYMHRDSEEIQGVL